MPAPSPPPEPPLQLFVRKRRTEAGFWREPFREGRRGRGPGGGWRRGGRCCSLDPGAPGRDQVLHREGHRGNSGPGGCSRSRPPSSSAARLLSSSSEQLLVSRLSASDSKPSRTSSASLVSVGPPRPAGRQQAAGLRRGGRGGHGHGQQPPPTVLTPGPAGCLSPRAANCASSPAAGPQVRPAPTPAAGPWGPGHSGAGDTAVPRVPAPGRLRVLSPPAADPRCGTPSAEVAWSPAGRAARGRVAARGHGPGAAAAGLARGPPSIAEQAAQDAVRSGCRRRLAIPELGPLHRKEGGRAAGSRAGVGLRAPPEPRPPRPPERQLTAAAASAS